MALTQVRLKRTVDSFVVVFPTLEAGETIAVPTERAAFLVDSGVVEIVEDERELETAALRRAKNRG